MQIDAVTIWTVIGGVFFVAIVIYLLPFILYPWLKPLKTLWGFYVGRRRRKPILLAAFPSQPTVSTANPGSPNNPQTMEDAIRKLIDQEFAYLDGIHQLKITSLQGKLDEVQIRLKASEDLYQKRRKDSENYLVRKGFSNSLEQINKDTGKDFLILLFICLLLIVDTLIARHIFVSLNIFVSEGNLTVLHVLGQDIPVDYPALYGLFFTIAAAFLLHIFWVKQKMKDFLNQSRWGFISGGVVLALFFVLRLLTVINPSIGQALIEVLTLTSWVIGVIGVYWLTGEIVGDNHDYFKLLVALSSPIILVLVILFGIPVLLEMLVEWCLKHFGRTWLGLTKTRTIKQKQNADEGQEAMKKGVYRGVTL